MILNSVDNQRNFSLVEGFEMRRIDGPHPTRRSRSCQTLYLAYPTTPKAFGALQRTSIYHRSSSYRNKTGPMIGKPEEN